MNEPAILNDCDGNMTPRTVYDACDFEESVAQAVHQPANVKLDNCFGEWTYFVEEDRCNQHNQRSAFSELTDPFTQSHLETSEHSTRAKEKIVDSQSPYEIFHSSFPLVSPSEDRATSEVEPLFQLLQKSSEPSPVGSPVLCDAAAPLWNCLLKEPSGLKKSQTSLCPSILRGLHSALRITENVASSQTETPAEAHPVESGGEPQRPPASPLIQTKLLAASHHRDGAGFLYQISHQWVSKHSLQLQDHNHKKGFFF